MAIRTYEQDGKVLFEIYVQGKDKLGKRLQYRRLAIQSKKEAVKIEFELKRELARLRGEVVSLHWEEWLSECIKKMKLHFKPSTIESYDKCLNKWCTPIWKGKEISKITTSEVHKVIYETLNPTLTPSTKKFILKMIKRIFQMAVEDGILARNPALGIKVEVPEVEQEVLNPEEVAKLLYEAKLNEHRFYVIWAFALFTGMRSGEMYALKWSDVDLTNKLIRVSRNWTNKSGMGPTKNRKCRNVPICADLETLLVELKANLQEFVLPRLEDWTRGQQAMVLKDFCRSIGVTPVKFHDLRATFITNMLVQGVSLAKVMSIVGHSDIDTTNKYLRKAGIEIKGATSQLGYKLPEIVGERVISFASARK